MLEGTGGDPNNEPMQPTVGYTPHVSGDMHIRDTRKEGITQKKSNSIHNFIQGKLAMLRSFIYQTHVVLRKFQLSTLFPSEQFHNSPENTRRHPRKLGHLAQVLRPEPHPLPNANQTALPPPLRVPTNV